MAKARATIVVPGDEEELPEDYHWVVDWFVRWQKDARVAGYSNVRLEHVWDVEGSREAIAELPPRLIRESDWSARSGGKYKSRGSAGKMKFSVSKAKRLRNRARRAAGEYRDDRSD